MGLVGSFGLLVRQDVRIIQLIIHKSKYVCQLIRQLPLCMYMSFKYFILLVHFILLNICVTFVFISKSCVEIVCDDETSLVTHVTLQFVLLWDYSEGDCLFGP